MEEKSTLQGQIVPSSGQKSLPLGAKLILTQEELTMAVEDRRTPAELLRQHDRIAKVRRDLIKQGLISGEATPQDVMDAIRRTIPPDMLPVRG